jgi:predicted Rossmann-fold nucleotide-binding protein
LICSNNRDILWKNALTLGKEYKRNNPILIVCPEKFVEKCIIYVERFLGKNWYVIKEGDEEILRVADTLILKYELYTKNTKERVFQLLQGT